MDINSSMWPIFTRMSAVPVLKTLIIMEIMVFSYARVSTQEQNSDRQID
ncbi:hypothetical protein [Clostridium tyrobutyricum]|jgi:hypothetical protein